jgi:hypothetical protein
MRFGQFCGALADELNLQHSDFILGAELLFTISYSESGEEVALSLPERHIGGEDAALLICLVIAMDLGAFDPSQSAETAQEIAAYGQNFPALLAALKNGSVVAITFPGRLETKVTLPDALMRKFASLVQGGKVTHLRSV